MLPIQGNIRAFKILSESGVAAGVRRIEALTSKGLMDYYGELRNRSFMRRKVPESNSGKYRREGLHILRLRIKNLTVK